MLKPPNIIQVRILETETPDGTTFQVQYRVGDSDRAPWRDVRPRQQSRDAAAEVYWAFVEGFSTAVDAMAVIKPSVRAAADEKVSR